MYSGGYYGLVVRVRRVRRHLVILRDNFKDPYRIASIFEMYTDVGKIIAGRKMGPIRLFMGHPGLPE